MRGRSKRHTVATETGDDNSRSIEDVRRLNFFKLSKNLLHFKVGRVELGSIQIVIDGFSGHRVTKRDLKGFDVPVPALTSLIVELGSTALGLQERQAQESHLRRALDGHIGMAGLIDFVQLP